MTKTTEPTTLQDVRDESLEPVAIQRPLRVYGDDAYPVWFRRPLPLDTPRARRPVFPSGTHLLEAGTIRREGALPLPCDIVLERDVEVVLRDGTSIHTDVYRPVGEGTYPALIGWSPYGKEFGGQWLDDFPHRVGVPLSMVSELQRFEGADPAYWVNQGYVVLSPDPRGVGKSGGDIVFWGRQLAEDGYDFVEWAAEQPWCSGKVALTGNSYLAISQWFIAAEQPPHLAAIAPWEGFSDHFRDAGNRGGVPRSGFSDIILATFSGTNLVEDQPRMMSEEQTRTPYWQDKQARLDRITVPAYVVASWTNPAHAHGTFAGYRGLASAEKWLRVHNTHEWVDYYDPAHVEELRHFFDHYLKGVDNDWTATPAVRLSVLDPGGQDVVDRVEQEFPLARTDHQRLYLGADSGLHGDLPEQESSVEYETGRGGAVTFTVTFSKDTELTGYMSLRLWVEARGSDDMELMVAAQKVGPDGRPFRGNPMLTMAASGVLRVSQRRLDPERSTASEPLTLNLDEERLAPGEIVQVDLDLWPMGMVYHAGETLQLVIGEAGGFPGGMPDPGFGVAPITVPADGGTYRPGTEVETVTLGGAREFPAFVAPQRARPAPSRNAGTHVIHLGGRYDSSLLIPVVPGH